MKSVSYGAVFKAAKHSKQVIKEKLLFCKWGLFSSSFFSELNSHWLWWTVWIPAATALQARKQKFININLFLWMKNVSICVNNVARALPLPHPSSLGSGISRWLLPHNMPLSRFLQLIVQVLVLPHSILPSPPSRTTIFSCPLAFLFEEHQTFECPGYCWESELTEDRMKNASASVIIICTYDC